jgi:beta-1,4-N-acetylglucosaminyltransferase
MEYPRSGISRDNVDVLLYACVGGHLDQLVNLAADLRGYKIVFVVNNNYASRQVMAGRTIRITHAERDWRQIINALEVIKILFMKRPRVIISTGSAPAVWFFYIGKLFGARLIFVESIARVDTLSLTGRLVKPIADHFFVQWPELARREKATYAGVVREAAE